MNIKKFRSREGFTLIEILVVIAILAIIAVVVFVALNPAQRFADARDSRRVNDVNSYLTAIHECIVDSDGAVGTCTGGVTAGQTYLITFDPDGAGVLVPPVTACNTVCAGVTDADNCEAMDTASTLSTYLSSLPVDPQGTRAATGHTEYTLSVDANNLVTVDACNAEGGPISASR